MILTVVKLPPPANDPDLTLSVWFTLLARALSEHYNVPLRKTVLTTLVNQCVEIELRHEKSRLDANKTLVAALRRVRQERPDIHIYFVSDMYLTREQIYELLRHYHIDDVFDDGVSSTDVQQAKHSGRLFSYIDTSGLFGPNFSILTNLHIGDNRHSDITMAMRSGSAALLTWKHRFRRLRTRIGIFKLHKIQQRAAKDEKERYKTFLGEPRNGTEAFEKMGKVFAAPLVAYLWHVAHLAEFSDKTTYMFVSSEATWFVEAGKKLFPRYFVRKSIQAEPRLNRKTMIRACVWALVMKERPELMQAVVATTRLGEIDRTSRNDIYGFLLGKDFPIGDLELQHVDEQDFYKLLYMNLHSATESQLEPLTDAYSFVNDIVSKKARHIVVCDVGWGGTVQMMLDQFMMITGLPHTVSGLYIGCHSPSRFGFRHVSPMQGYLLGDVIKSKDRAIWNPVLWEYAYTNKIQYQDDITRLKYVQRGLAEGYDYFSKTSLSPCEFFRAVAKPEIHDLLNNPSKLEARTLGSIRLDIGFVDTKPLPILDLRRPISFVWAKFLLRPKRSFKYIIQPNFWTAAYITYYHLFGARFMLKIAGKIKKTRYL